MKIKTGKRLAVISIFVLLAGCASESRPTRFYSLSPAANIKADLHEAINISIAIGPVELPDQLDRPQVVTRISRHELKLAEYHHWAGSLKRNFTLTLAENISSMLGVKSVYIYPSRSNTTIDYQVTAEITRFDGYIGGEATLSVIWSVLKKDGKSTLVTEKSVITEKVLGPGYGDLVAAQSMALDRFSLQIADVIRSDARK